MMLLISGNLNSEETDSKPRKHFDGTTRIAKVVSVELVKEKAKASK